MEKAEAMLSLHTYQSKPHMLQLVPVRKHRRVGTERECIRLPARNQHINKALVLVGLGGCRWATR